MELIMKTCEMTIPGYQPGANLPESSKENPKDLKQLDLLKRLSDLNRQLDKKLMEINSDKRQDSQKSTPKSITSICDDDEGNIWIGSDYGIDILNSNKELIRHMEKIPGDTNSLINNHVWNIYRDKKNYMWIATFNDALEKYDPKTGEFKHFYDLDGKGFICLSIFEDKNENLWLGLFQDGVRVYNKNMELRKKYLTTENGNLEFSQIRPIKIIEDNKENIWIATNKGLAMLDKSTDSIIFYKNIPGDTNSINNNLIMSIIKDKYGNIWASTRYGGLNRFDPESKTFKNYMKRNEPISYSGFGLLLDDNENIWMNTEKSISMFNPTDETFTHYFQDDVLDRLPFRSYFKSKYGEMFFGNFTGFYSFYPDRIPKNINIPDIVLTSFKIFNTEVKLKTSIIEIKEIIISYKDNFFSFDFAALDYTNPEMNQHAFMLEGVDKDWNYVGNIRTASYTDIKPGDYTFRVKGSNNDGVWNEEGASVRLIITPPWYETLWLRDCQH